MKIKMFGLGAIGANLLLSLTRQFPDYDYEGIDFDTVEDKNTKTQPYFIEHVGMLKAIAMRVLLTRYNQKIKYTPNTKKLVSRPTMETDCLYIDAFDNTESRKLLHTPDEKTLFLPSIHVGFSPSFTAECLWDEKYDPPNDVDVSQADICTQQEALSFIQLVVARASMTIGQYLNEGAKENWIITGKNKITLMD